MPVYFAVPPPIGVIHGFVPCFGFYGDRIARDLVADQKVSFVHHDKKF
jgi:hypothetical protein